MCIVALPHLLRSGDLQSAIGVASHGSAHYGGLAMDLPNASHRPWPLLHRPWVMAMQWHDLLFMHWPVPPAVLRPLIPPALALETFDGAAWLGVTPFRMAGTRPRLNQSA